MDVYTQMMFTDYRSIAQIAPGGIFFDTSTINCDNPYLPASRLATIGCTPALVASGGSTTMYIGRRNTEGGGRQQSFSNTSFRAIVGARGALSDNWDYDVSFQRSTVKANEQTLNYFVIDRINKALDAVRLPNGTIGCRDAGARADGCAERSAGQRTARSAKTHQRWLKVPTEAPGGGEEEAATEAASCPVATSSGTASSNVAAGSGDLCSGRSCASVRLAIVGPSCSPLRWWRPRSLRLWNGYLRAGRRPSRLGRAR